MAHKKNTTNLTELLLQCVTQPDPMLSMLEWLCTELMEAEVDQQLGAEKSQRTDGRSGYRSGYRPRHLDTRMGTMYRMAGSPAVSGGSAFSDVPSGKWYSDAVQWASANGVVNGVGRDRFAPEAQITREQMASMMMRYAQFNQYNTSKSADLSAFNDAGSISSWALESMKWANAAGLINGRTASTIAPQGTATRAEAATILMRFCEMSK